MTVSVVVPWRGDGAQRDRLWKWCRDRWESLRDLGVVDEIIECDSGQEPFTRGTSLNRGVERAAGDVLVLADADTFVDEIAEALELLASGAPWVVAYGWQEYYRVSPADTDAYLAYQLPTTLRPFRFLEQCVSRSGCNVLTREGFDRVNGFPETLRGWGYEDDCFVAAMDTLVGPHARTRGFAVQLYHEHIEAERFHQPHIAENRRVSDLYAAARQQPDVMRALVRSQRRPSGGMIEAKDLFFVGEHG